MCAPGSPNLFVLPRHQTAATAPDAIRGVMLQLGTGTRAGLEASVRVGVCRVSRFAGRVMYGCMYVWTPLFVV